MSSRLVVLTGPDKGRDFSLSPEGSLLLGRSRATTTRLTDPEVSRIHCEVEAENGPLMIHDWSSASGTFVNGQRVTSQELRPGDVIRIGGTELRLESVAPAGAIVFAARPGVRPLAAPLRRLQDLAGQRLGRYQIQELLGTGQVGLVFRARDVSAQAPVALKVLKPEFARDGPAMQRFIRGLEAMQPLRHPHLVDLYAAGQTEPYWWLAMELVEGPSLAQLVAQRGRGGSGDWRQGLRLAVHITRALAFAHGHGIVHRNILPANILIRSTDGVAKLSDLMLARAVEDVGVRALTEPGELVGNVYYMSPERTHGSAGVDGRSDLFSLGVTLYQALTGRLPFTGTSLTEVITQIRRAEPAPPRALEPALPEGLEAVVLKLLARRPDDRPPTAGALLAQLCQLASTHAVPA
jgi:serine/threonine-protein kinase